MSALDDYVAAGTDDDARLALGLEALESAWSEARECGLLGWAEDINEYVHALRGSKGLNRPPADR